MCRILRQISIRNDLSGGKPERDEGGNYRDYILATGRTHAVWELIECAFGIAGIDLNWNLEGDDSATWRADFRSTATPAVVVDQDLLRDAEPQTVQVDPSRARKELHWAHRGGLELFLRDMYTKLTRVNVAQTAQS
jgi:GDP-D-mannose dehydratase